jgi:uncharacterized protein YlxW (UPF0749 family)
MYYFLVITIFIGYLITVQIRSNITPNQGIVTIPKILEMQDQIDNIKRENLNLASSINETKIKLDEYKSSSKSGSVYENMAKELEKTRNYADYETLEGPGIIISMNDSLDKVEEGENPNWYLIHDGDILEIINELRGAGAEAIATNDERVAATSNIRCGGPTINIDGKRHAVPFVIKAIGNPEALAKAAEDNPTYIELKEWGFQLKMVKDNNITILKSDKY